MNIIIMDCETTGLLMPIAANYENQPHIVEFVAIKINAHFDEIGRLEFRCKPPIAIPQAATKVHGITDHDVRDFSPFVEFYPTVAAFFLGSHYVIGHNVMFDKMCLYWELFRIGKTLNFPWAPGVCCTVEASQQINGTRMNLMDLHIHLFGVGFDKAHSGNADCDATKRCFVEMVNRGMIQL